MGGILEAISAAATASHQNDEIASHRRAVLRTTIPKSPDASAI